MPVGSGRKRNSSVELMKPSREGVRWGKPHDTQIKWKIQKHREHGNYNAPVIIGRKIPDVSAIHQKNASAYCAKPAAILFNSGWSLSPIAVLLQFFKVICKEKFTFGSSSLCNFPVTFYESQESVLQKNTKMTHFRNLACKPVLRL